MAITSEAIGIGQALGPGRSWKKPWLPRGCIASSPGSSRGEGWGEGCFRADGKRRTRGLPLTRRASRVDLPPQAGPGAANFAIH